MVLIKKESVLYAAVTFNLGFELTSCSPIPIEEILACIKINLFYRLYPVHREGDQAMCHITKQASINARTLVWHPI